MPPCDGAHMVDNPDELVGSAASGRPHQVGLHIENGGEPNRYIIFMEAIISLIFEPLQADDEYSRQLVQPCGH